MTKSELQSMITEMIQEEIESIEDNTYLEECLFTEDIMFKLLDSIIRESYDILEESHGSRQRKARAEGKPKDISRQDWNKNSDYVKDKIKQDAIKSRKVDKNIEKLYYKFNKQENPNINSKERKDDKNKNTFAKILKNNTDKEQTKLYRKRKANYDFDDLYENYYNIIDDIRVDKDSAINDVANKISSAPEDKKELTVVSQTKAKEEAADSIAKKLGKRFKAVGGRIISVYSGKDGKSKQVAAIAATATALAASIGAAAYIKAKKKAKAKEEENKKK